MSIHDLVLKIKSFRIKENLDVKEDIFIVVAIILIGLAGFSLGKLSALEKGREPVTIQPVTTSFSSVVATTTNNSNNFLVASKTGTKYYFPWCSGVSKISEKNKVWFDSYSSAQAAGLTPAANCPNLK